MIYTPQAKTRMEEYGIDESSVEDTIKNPENLFLDIKTGRLIAVKKQNKKWLIVVYEGDDGITIITVFPTSKINKIVDSRTKNGRWLEL